MNKISPTVLGFEGMSGVTLLRRYAVSPASRFLLITSPPSHFVGFLFTAGLKDRMMSHALETTISELGPHVHNDFGVLGYPNPKNGVRFDPLIDHSLMSVFDGSISPRGDRVADFMATLGPVAVMSR